MKLRPYHQEAVDGVREAWKELGGGGRSGGAT